MITKEQADKMVPAQRPPTPTNAGLAFGLDVMALRRESLKGTRVARKAKQ